MATPKNTPPIGNFDIARTSGQIKGATLDKDFSSNNFFRTSPINTSTLPVILSFTVTPAVPASGNNQVLSWVTSGGTSWSIDNGIGAVASSGSMTVAPAVITTYTLSVTNNVGTVTQTATATPISTPVENVFSAFTYTGTGANITVNNGINLATNGGMVWLKERTSTENHLLMDTARGNNSLSSNLTAIQSAIATFTANANGFTSSAGIVNANNYISWTFRKAPGFFDIVTWNGDNAGTRAIAHSLGVVPGMIIIKATNAVQSWYVWHKDFTGPGLYLDLTGVFPGDTRGIAAVQSNSQISVTDVLNATGTTYVAYIFGHDATASGLIQCGTFTTDGAGAASVNLGWEPQFILEKAITGTASWAMVDASRGLTVSSDAFLQANVSDAEASADLYDPTATGFNAKNRGLTTTYIYLAIRRGPMATPTSGVQVYQGIARAGTGAVATITGVGFPPDLVMDKSRSGIKPGVFWDRLRGATNSLNATATTAEATDAAALTALDTMDGFSVGIDGTNGNINTNAVTYMNWCLRRNPGVFDIVCYTGTGVAHTEAHNLGATPELMIVKGRSGATAWEVYSADATGGAGKVSVLNTTAIPAADATAWNNTAPTSSVFSVGANANTNTNAATYAAYLFATLAGISKVGSYTGNGTSVALNCGFVGNARFLLVKRTDAVSDWFVWDNSRGMGAGNDPHLSLNTSAVEVTTDDSVSALTGGVTVNQVAATNINVLNGTYIFLALS